MTDRGFLLAKVLLANKGGLASKLVPAIVVPMMNFRLSMLDEIEKMKAPCLIRALKLINSMNHASAKFAPPKEESLVL
jgi:hypothetical protein